MFFESLFLNVSILGALIIALLFDYVTKFFSYWYVRHVPYKTPVPLFGSDYHRVLGIRNRSEEVNNLYSSYAKEKYVGCIKSRIPDLIVKDPNSIKKILSTDFSNFHCRGYGLDGSQDVCIRNNLFYSEGEKWTLLRGRMELLLNNMDLDIQDSLHECLSGTNGDTNVQQLLSEILDVVFKDLLIDNKLDGSVVRNTRELLQKRTLFEKLKSYLKDVLPSVYVMFGLNVLSEQYFSKFAQVLEESKLMKDIKKSETIFQDENDNAKKFKLSEYDLITSYLAVFIGEGYIPCHYVLTGLLYELAKNPELQENARKCLNNRTEGDCLSHTIKEVLRLYPPYSVITRKCVKTYQFSDKDFSIDKGITITIPVELLQRDEAYYKDANEFNPKRFELNNGMSDNSYLPFGAGPRKCVGQQLALRIIDAVVTVILKTFIIEPCETLPDLIITDYNFKRFIDNNVSLKFKPIS
ncbi:cytochrome P450 6B1-like [Vanessa atalanta]|uniref:cytochrome P450 6B1-like n=1 Tax=Vanessa atalanta TaxID=42275 RepID=UPI001FCD8FAF|nr:cytochrome P450 6B1-like [Vanessa atalanta]